MPNELTLATFRSHVASTFRLELDDSAIDLVLVEATGPTEDEPPRPKDLRTPFSLTFRGPAQPVLPQRIYRLSHPEVGELDIFLVPRSADAEATTYEAVFG